jgi:hypothetical protein
MGKVYTNIGSGAPKKKAPSSTTTSIPQRWKDAAARVKKTKASSIAQYKSAPPPEGFTKPKPVQNVHGTPVYGGGGMHQMGTAQKTKVRKEVGKSQGKEAKEAVKTHKQELDESLKW